MAKGKFSGSSEKENMEKKTLRDLSKMADTDKVVIVSEKRAGKTIVGVEKTPVSFDADGKAEVTAKEARYFLTVPGFELEESEDSDTSNSDGGNADSEKGGSDGKEETPKDGSEKTDGGNADSAKTDETKDSENAGKDADAEKTKAAKKAAKENK